MNNYEKSRKLQDLFKKIMSFKKKIDKILENNTLGINSVYALEKAIGASTGSVNGFYNDDREPGQKIVKKIKKTFSISDTQWLDVEKGDKSSSFQHQIFEGDYVGLHKNAWTLFEDAMRSDKELLKDLAATLKNLTRAGGNQ